MITQQTNANWNPLPPLPSPNGGFSCGALDGKIVVLGGSNWEGGSKHWLDSIWTFNPKSMTWETQRKLPHPLAYAIAANWNGDLLIAGGSDGMQPRKEVWRLSPSLKLERSGELGNAAVLGAGGVLGESLLILGGCANAAKLDGLRKGGERFHIPTSKATALAPPGDVAFGLAAGVVVEKELFLFGGAKHDPIKQFVDLNNAWAFSAEKATWRSLKPYPLIMHGSGAVKLDEHRILIAGGYSGDPQGFTAAAFIYDTRQDSYTKTTDLPIAGMVGLVRAGDFIYCLGGEDKSPKHRTALCARVKVAEYLKAASLD